MLIDSGKTSKYDELASKKLAIETELESLGKTLAEEGNVGMHGNLIDDQGYPRADIDIYKIRLTRQRINCLQNDYKELLDQIELELSNQFSKKNATNESNGANNLRPFMKIEQVDPDSPSCEAGLKKGDLIIQFGACTDLNTKKDLSDVAKLVKDSVNKIVLVKVSRKVGEEDEASQISTSKLTLKLTPKPWSGHGLLGCKLIPVD